MHLAVWASANSNLFHMMSPKQKKKNLEKLLDSCLANKMVPMSKPNFTKLLSHGELVELSLGWSLHKQV